MSTTPTEGRGNKRTALHVALVGVIAAAVLAVPGDATTRTQASGSATNRAAPLSVNLALGATATATSAASGQPAANAVDGSATTTWCATQWTGTVTIDLGAVRKLDSVGVSLGAAAFPSSVAISLATGMGSWRPVSSAQNIALEANTPSYVALAGVQSARFAQVTVTTGDGSPACVGEIRLFGRDRATDRMMLGADLSFTQQEEAAGTRFTDAGERSDPLRIMRAHGGDWVRMRLWLDPPAGYSDLANDLALARRAKAARIKIYLDIHYSDFWADPQHQDIPAAWQGQDLATLAETVRSYTHDVIAAFARQGTPVDMVSIGNEIRNGMLWPIGQIDWTADTGWDNLATLLRAGVTGAASANPRGHRLRVMLHYDQGGNNPGSTRFFTNMIDRGVEFDVIGLSYYTFFHGPVAGLRDNVNRLATQFDKDIVIAEAQSAWTLANGDTTGNFVWQRSQIEAGYPASAGGQLSLNNDLLSILAHAPNGRGMGLFYWSPEWVPGVGWTPGAGTPNDNLTLYDFQGRALPSIGMFENPTVVCRRYDRFAVPCVVPG